MKKYLPLLIALLILLTFIFFNSLTEAKVPTSYVSIISTSIPNTKTAKKIIKTVEKAYAIESEAGYTFDLSKLSTVFINDPRFPLDPSMLQVVRELSKNPTLESSGYLDYKMAYYSWRRESALHAEKIFATAKAENRDLTAEETKSLVDPQGRMASPRSNGSKNTLNLIFCSVETKEDIALVTVDDGPGTVELTLVLVKGNWYIAGIKGIAFHP
jgi:hypothetical protein